MAANKDAGANASDDAGDTASAHTGNANTNADGNAIPDTNGKDNDKAHAGMQTRKARTTIMHTRRACTRECR